jgi:hypothetical protein
MIRLTTTPARKRYLNQSLPLYGGEAAVQQTGVPFWEALS